MENQIEGFKKLPRELEKPAFAAKTTGKIEAILEPVPASAARQRHVISAALSLSDGAGRIYLRSSEINFMCRLNPPIPQ
jgi:hypothetical protein